MRILKNSHIISDILPKLEARRLSRQSRDKNERTQARRLPRRPKDSENKGAVPEVDFIGRKYITEGETATYRTAPTSAETDRAPRPEPRQVRFVQMPCRCEAGGRAGRKRKKFPEADEGSAFLQKTKISRIFAFYEKRLSGLQRHYARR